MQVTRVNITQAAHLFSEAEIEDLLATELRRRAGFARGAGKVHAFHTTRDKTGTAGIEHCWKVTVEVDHAPAPAEAEAPEA